MHEQTSLSVSRRRASRRVMASNFLPNIEALEPRQLLANVAGGLDPTFGSGGRVLAAGSPAAVDMAIDATNHTIVAGTLNGDIFIARYKTDGTLDGTFGSGGHVVTHLSAAASVGGVALQSDGKIVITGSFTGGNGLSSVLVARYT